MKHILTCVRANDNTDALDACLQGLTGQEAPAGVLHMIAVFDDSGAMSGKGYVAQVCAYWAKSAGRKIAVIPAPGLEPASLDMAISEYAGSFEGLDYVAVLDAVDAPRAGWLQAMYDATACGADIVQGAFTHNVPWDSNLKLVFPKHDRRVLKSNTITRAAWLRDEWAAFPRWGFAGQASVTVFTKWEALTWREALRAGWRVGYGAPLHLGVLLAQLAHGLGRLVVALTTMQSYARGYLMAQAFGELGEVGGAICGRGR